MKVYVVTNKESQIVGYGENLKNLVEKLDLEDHHIYSLNLGKDAKISNGKMYPVMVQIENGEASMEVYEGVESPVFISEPMVYIEFITTNKFMVCVSTIFTFEEDYEIIRALVKYIIRFIATAKESITDESDVNELVSIMNESYPTIPGLGFPMNSANYNEYEKKTDVRGECVWTRKDDEMNYMTECGSTYFPYAKPINQPKIVDGLCPWCGKNIKYNEEDVE